MVPILNLDTPGALGASFSLPSTNAGAMLLSEPNVSNGSDAERVRELIESRRRADESWTQAVNRFALEMHRDPSTVWRWIDGGRIPKHLRRALFPND